MLSMLVQYSRYPLNIKHVGSVQQVSTNKSKFVRTAGIHLTLSVMVQYSKYPPNIKCDGTVQQVTT
jgi:hypothetical protein